MTKLTEILSRKRRLLTTEFLPPKTPNLSELVTKTLRVANVIDSVNLPDLKASDRSFPKHRMNPLYTACRLRDLTGVEALFHLTPRDYNKNAIAGLLLAAAEAGLQNILVIGGDRYSDSETLTLSKNVYDFNGSLDLIQRVLSFEAEVGIPDSDGFCILVGTDPTVIYTHDEKRIENEITKLVDGQDAGADLVQTQPVFDARFFEFLDIAREHGLKIPVLAGVLPLRGEADAREIEQRYGITIPREVKLSIKDGADGDRLACELALDLVRNGIRALHAYPRENCEFLLELARTAFGSN